MTTADPITTIRWRRVAVPFRSALSNSQATYRVRESVLIEISTESGAIGIGEAALPAGSTFAEHADAIESRLDALAGATRGRTAGDAWHGTPFALAKDEYARWPAAVVCGFETALADLAAKREGMPLAGWLAKDEAASAATIVANGLVDLVEPADAATYAGNLVAAGFRTLKLKVGGDVGASIATVAAVREAVGFGIELRCDANRSWSVEDAWAFLAGSAPFEVAVLEEPLAQPGNNFVRLAVLQADSRTLLAVDESARSIDALDRAISAGIKLLVVKPMASGLRTSLELVRRARLAGMQVIVTTTFDLAPGTAMAMHVAALADPGIACGLATIDLVAHPLGGGVPATSRGELTLSGAPGLGVVLDHAAVERFAAGAWKTSAD